jgi:hypothetical protein
LNEPKEKKAEQKYQKKILWKERAAKPLLTLGQESEESWEI